MPDDDVTEIRLVDGHQYRVLRQIVAVTSWVERDRGAMQIVFAPPDDDPDQLQTRRVATSWEQAAERGWIEEID